MDNASLRRSVYGLLLTLTLGITVARVVGVEFVYDPSLYHAYPTRIWPSTAPERSPTFSSNDRSRWATIRALVEKGTFVIGHRTEDTSLPAGYREAVNAYQCALGGAGAAPASLVKSYRDEGMVFQDGYRSVDVMLNPETKDFYSTKPPLLTLLAAGEYWVLYHGLGWTLQEHRWEVVCTVLLTFNVLPLAVYLVLLARMLERYGSSDWGRLFVFAAACLGTFLTTFAVTLNNHTPAAFCVLFAVCPLLRGGRKADTEPPALGVGSLLVSGFFAGMAACLDLPAAAFVVGLGLLVVIGQRSLLAGVWFAVGAAVPMAVLLAANHLALGEWNVGYSKWGTEWYDYPGSHWLKRFDPNAKGIDFAREDNATYAFHLILGHHGLLSLTPIWFLAGAGALWAARGLLPSAIPGESIRGAFPNYLSVLSAVLTCVVVGFLLSRTENRNYGGWTSGPRWLFWLTPLYLFAMIPVADGLARHRAGRSLGLLLLALSVFSACYPVWNPWRHPWLYQLCEYTGWIRY